MKNPTSAAPILSHSGPRLIWLPSALLGSKSHLCAALTRGRPTREHYQCLRGKHAALQGGRARAIDLRSQANASAPASIPSSPMRVTFFSDFLNLLQASRQNAAESGELQEILSDSESPL